MNKNFKFYKSYFILFYKARKYCGALGEISNKIVGILNVKRIDEEKGEEFIYIIHSYTHWFDDEIIFIFHL